MGKYEDWDLIKDLVKNIYTDGYFRIWYVSMTVQWSA